MDIHVKMVRGMPGGHSCVNKLRSHNVSFVSALDVNRDYTQYLMECHALPVLYFECRSLLMMDRFFSKLILIHTGSFSTSVRETTIRSFPYKAT